MCSYLDPPMMVLMQQVRLLSHHFVVGVIIEYNKRVNALAIPVSS